MYRTFNKIFQAFKIVEDPIEKIKEKEEVNMKQSEAEFKEFEPRLINLSRGPNMVDST